MAGYAHVAIDGPAGSGKTTVARSLARKLGILNLDTGAMYRALALAALRNGAPVDDEAALLRLAEAYPIRVALDRGSAEGFRVFAGDDDVGDELYSNEVSTVVSTVAAHPGVRSLMVERQRAIARDGPVVMAGRDIGTIVLPDAPVKVYLTASLDERVKRRLAELAEHGTVLDREELKRQMAERDRLDESRPVAPLRPAEGALLIDSTSLTVEEVTDRIAAAVEAAAGP